jgi:hypothetical protein
VVQEPFEGTESVSGRRGSSEKNFEGNLSLHLLIKNHAMKKYGEV